MADTAAADIVVVDTVAAGRAAVEIRLAGTAVPSADRAVSVRLAGTAADLPVDTV